MTRRRPAQVIVVLLAALLGFGLAVQVRTTQAGSALGSARPEDLLRIIDDLTARSDRLAQEEAELRSARERLATAVDRDSAAVAEAKRRIDTLAVLAGTVAAHGPGIRVVVDDPGHTLHADFLVDVIQELRDAGAETMMINQHRIGASSYAVDRGVEVVLDGTALAQPYTVVAIGAAATMDIALGIPHGIVETAQDAGARIVVQRSDDVVVDALRPLPTPRYARPDSSE